MIGRQRKQHRPSELVHLGLSNLTEVLSHRYVTLFAEILKTHNVRLLAKH
jgi:hypothetical protein